MGNPLVTVNEFYIQTWSAIDNVLLSKVSITDSGLYNSNYDSTATAGTFTLSISGTEGTTIKVSGDFVFKSGNADPLTIEYSGNYVYETD